jgi:hypothetical protein
LAARVRSSSLLLGGLVAAAMACGSSRQRPSGSDGGVDTATPCQVSPEGAEPTCGDAIDNDCDGLVDCSDPNCSAVGACPVCGMVDYPLGQPLALPDGIGDISCTTDADCATIVPGPQQCFDLLGSTHNHECRQSYVSTLHFVGFGPQTFEDPSNIVSVCVTMEHSWIRDTEISLRAPDGKTVRLQAFEGQSGGEVYLGEANDDDDVTPVPGVGAEYCWKPTATNAPILDYANQGGPMLEFNGHAELPPGDYQASDPWTNVVGAPLNGDWSLSVADLWPIDNGYIFDWSITFDADLISDCSAPIIGRTGPHRRRLP